MTDTTSGKDLVAYVNQHVDTIPKAHVALDALAKQIDSATTYEEFKQAEDFASALKILFKGVDDVKHRWEVVILDARARIGEELAKVPKAVHRGGPKKQFTTDGKLVGRAAAVPSGTGRARLKKLAKLGKPKRHAIAKELQEEGKDATVSAVLRIVKEAEIKEQRKALEARRDKGATVADLVAVAEQGLKFNVVCPDCPWEFRTYSGRGKQRSAERYYDTSSLDALKEFGKKYVLPLAARNCALLMWFVRAEMSGAIEVAKSWGFEVKTMAFDWIKTTKSARIIDLDGKGLHWGMGYYTRSNTEYMLLATRGNPKRLAKDVHQVVVAPVGEHSAKPDEIYRRIERLFPGPYLELFARRPRKGWTCWGHELPSQGKLSDAAE